MTGVFDNAKIDDFIHEFESDGKRHVFFDRDKAMALLLLDNVCNTDSRRYLEVDWGPRDDWEVGQDPTTVIFVNANDVFAWAVSDCVEVTSGDEVHQDDDGEGKNELYELLKEHLADRRWGSIKWICKKRNMGPQSPIVRDMIKDGAWTPDMQSLPHNPTDDKCCEWHRNLAKENRTNG